MHIPQTDIDVLRRLAEQQATIAALPIHKEKTELWRKLNQREVVRPLVWINEVPWHEMNVGDELTIQSAHPWAQTLETKLRRTLYQWRHFPGDMIMDDTIACPLVIHSTGFSIHEDVEIVKTDAGNSVVSRHFNPQIVEPHDIEKIQFPHVTYDADTTNKHYQTMRDIFSGILPVKKVGIKGAWFAPWDLLICWWGVEQAMIDLIERPAMVNAAMTRLVDAYLHELDQWESLNLLARNDDNTRIGSGAYGYTDELPGKNYDVDHVRPQDLWGCATAQIFSDVSPRMHWTFALQHELRWLKRWGLTYYGCCEPLDRKIEILRRIPNLRKLSVSPWNNTERIVSAVGTDYVLSRKPNPAILAEDVWRPQQARQDLSKFLEQAQGSHIEIIMKDISTVRYQPRRLWEWEKIAMKVAKS